jgi:hypothetical protein
MVLRVSFVMGFIKFRLYRCCGYRVRSGLFLMGYIRDGFFISFVGDFAFSASITRGWKDWNGVDGFILHACTLLLCSWLWRNSSASGYCFRYLTAYNYNSCLDVLASQDFFIIFFSFVMFVYHVVFTLYLSTYLCRLHEIVLF